jgi:V/A-type H+-transporting ATPase subunit I
LLFYGSIIIAVAVMILFGKNIISLPLIIICFIIPIILIFFKEPLMHLIEHKKEIIPGSKGEFFMTGFFEVFEVLLSYFSNTVSFMRVGAYILSHAGLMLAVLSISSLMGGGGIIMVVLGNIFVIGLEGLLAGIQGIRLHFYEMFSRFYEGEGKPFTPVKIEY